MLFLTHREITMRKKISQPCYFDTSQKKMINHHCKLIILILFTALTGFGCTRMYTRPAAPPESEWKAVEEPKESQEELTRRFLDTKRAAIQCYAALADSKWKTALEWMSSDSVDFFESHSNGQGAESVFENGTIFIDGEEKTFDPIGDVFIGGLTDIRDDFGSRTDDESKTRKVLYAVSSSGEAREMVFIYENEKWRLQYTQFPPQLLTE